MMRRRILPVGFRSHMLTVIADAGVDSRGASMARVRCDCGVEKTERQRALVDGKTKSCGCWRRTRTGNLNLKHGEARTDGDANTPEYRAWRNMISRCESSCWRDFANYGGRGIRVCERWRESFEAFLEDVGRRPSPQHSIDRYPNVDGNYEPGNVRWATLKEQARNKRNTLWLTVDGVKKSAAEWADLSGITQRAIEYRIKSGWAPKRIVAEPLRVTLRRPQEAK